MTQPKDLTEALSIISECLGLEVKKIISSDISVNKDLVLGYDEKLCIEIATACISWKNRVCPIQDPWKVGFFNGESWELITNKPLYQQDAYRIWYKQTNGGTQLHQKSCGQYYCLINYFKDFETNDETQDEDDFSISYLLTKSFGG